MVSVDVREQMVIAMVKGQTNCPAAPAPEWLERYGLLAKIGSDHVFRTDRAAVDAFKSLPAGRR